MVKLADLSEGKVHIKLMINSVNKGVTNKGIPYLSLNLQDNTRSIDAKYWDVKEEEIDKYQPGMLVGVDGDIIKYNNAFQLRVKSLVILDLSKEDVREYVPSSPISKEELMENIQEVIDNISNDNLKKITAAIIKKYEKEFYTYPAASSIHHNFVGGLATHVLGMLETAKFLVSHYPLLNLDLLSCGVILHDVGKIRELSGPVATTYTMEGKLLGHISIMQAEIYEVAKQFGIEESEESTLLRHMILSHHGEYEYGSPIKPLLPEAEMLTYVDNIDAKMNVLEKNLALVEPGEFTGKIFALDGRCFYKSKMD